MLRRSSHRERRMYPYLRLMRVMREARRKAPLKLGEVSEIELRCWPWDIDPFRELNNGRTLTLYDLGRFELSERLGLIRLLKQNRWSFAVAGASVRWRHRVTMWQRMTMRTATLGWEGRWFYIGQSIAVDGRPVSSLLARTAIRSREGTVTGEQLAAALGTDWAPPLPGWVSAWTAADDQRPWPPEP